MRIFGSKNKFFSENLIKGFPAVAVVVVVLLVVVEMIVAVMVEVETEVVVVEPICLLKMNPLVKDSVYTIRMKPLFRELYLVTDIFCEHQVS